LLLMFIILFCHQISKLPQAITVKLCHMIESWFSLIIQVPKFWALPKTNFYRPKTCKIWRNFRQLQTLIANICGTNADIQNQKDAIDCDCCRFDGKSKSYQLFRKTILWLIGGDREFVRNGLRYQKSEMQVINYSPSHVKQKNLVNFGPVTKKL